MIISKTNPVAEDYWIHQLLVDMEASLLPQWGVLTGTCKFFGRADVVKVNGKDNEVFYSASKPQDIYTSDKFNFISYVSCDPSATANGLQKKINSYLVCQADLSKLYPAITHRADAELRRDIEAVLLRHIEPQEYKGYATIMDDAKDMHPFYTVKFNYEIVL